MTAADGNFYLTMAFDAEDRPVLRVGEGHGARIFDTLGKARGQRKRWVNGYRPYASSSRLYHHYPKSKVFHMTYVAGVLMATEVDCD